MEENFPAQNDNTLTQKIQIDTPAQNSPNPMLNTHEITQIMSGFRQELLISGYSEKTKRSGKIRNCFFSRQRKRKKCFQCHTRINACLHQILPRETYADESDG